MRYGIQKPYSFTNFTKKGVSYGLQNVLESHHLPTPLAGGQRKIICGANEFSLASGQGGGHLIFGTSFDFPLCHPKGAHSLGHCLGQFPTSGCKFNFPLCYPKGAHSLHHRLGQFPTSGAKFNFPSCYPKGAHSLGHRRGQLLTSFFKHRQNIEVNVFFRTSPKNRIVKNWETLHC